MKTVGSGETFPHAAPHHPISPERLPALRGRWWDGVKEVDLISHLVLAPGREKAPKSLGDYRFVPVVHDNPNHISRDLRFTSRLVKTEPGVAFEYKRPGSRPFIDGRGLGLGLAYRDRLVALCAGDIAEEGPIVLQLQDVSNKVPPDTTDAKILRSFPFSNGLSSGIDWKMTLLNGWCRLASVALPGVLPEMDGMPLWVQSADNNTWARLPEYGAQGNDIIGYTTNQEMLDQFRSTYDQTARDIGGKLVEPSRNFLLPAQFAVGHCIATRREV